MTEIMEQPTEEDAGDSWIERCKECGSQMVETGRGGFTQNDDCDVDYINYECPSCGYKFCDI